MEGITSRHVVVFLLTFLGYGLFDLVRKSLSFSKASIISEWTPAHYTTHAELSCPEVTCSRAGRLFEDEAGVKVFLGQLNAVFLFLYGAGLFLSGWLAERLDKRVLLSCGMVLTALTMLLFGPGLQWSAWPSRPAYLALMALNGLLQATGWPCVVAAMGHWFAKDCRGFVLGLWTSSSSFGSIVGALMAAAVVDYGYEYVFLVSTSALLAGGVVIFFGLVTSPRELGLPMPDEDHQGCGVEQLAEGDVVDKAGHQHRQGVHVSLEIRDSPEELTSGLNTREGTQGSLESSNPPRETSYNVKQRKRVQGYLDTPSKISVCFQSRRHNACVVSRPACKKGPRHKITPTVTYGSTDQYVSVVIQPDRVSIAEESGDKWTCAYDSPSQGQDSSDKDLLWGTEGLRERQGMRSQGRLAVDLDLNISTQTDILEFDDSVSHSKDERPLTKIAQGEQAGANKSHPLSRPTAIGFCRAMLLPGVVCSSLASAFLKLVNYTFFFWLPLYLTAAHGWPQSQADQMSVWFEVGGMLGAALTGWLVSRLGRQAVVMLPMLSLSIPLLYLLPTLPAAGRGVLDAVLLTLLGVLVGGVNNILSAAVAADLGRQEALRGRVEALSTLAGIIEGTGTLGAALGQLAVPRLNTAYGWTAVFYLMMVAMALTVLNILPMLVAEVKDMVRNRQQQH